MERFSLLQSALLARLYPLTGRVPAGWRRFEGFERLLSAVRHPPAPDVLYLGDSVVERVSREDADTATLGGMVAAALAPHLRTLVITHSAYNPDVYLPLVECLRRTRVRPRAILLPINLRCFSPQWMHHPLWQFQDEIAVLKRARFWRRQAPLLPIRGKPSSVEMCSYEAIRLDCGVPGMETIGDFRRIITERPRDEGERIGRLQAILSLHYLFDLPSELPRLRRLRECVATAHELGLDPVVYLTPINAEVGTRLLGGAFAAGVDRTIRAILAELEESGVEVADYSRAFSSAEFFHADEPTEHLNAAGRRRLAGMLTSTLGQRLSSRRAP